MVFGRMNDTYHVLLSIIMLPESLAESEGIFRLLDYLHIVARYESEQLSPQKDVPKISLESNTDANLSVHDDGEETQAEVEEAEEAVDLQESEQAAIEEAVIEHYLDLLSKELVPDEDLSQLPPDNIGKVFPFFMNAKFSMPIIDETPLGMLLLKKKEEQIEDLTIYELEQMLNFTLKENKMLEIQNNVFNGFLKKNDPRYEAEDVSSLIPRHASAEEKTLDITSSEMIASKVIFPVLEDYDSTETFLKVLDLFVKVVEHEIKVMHKQYEKEVNAFNTKMKDTSAIQNSLKIHRDKLRETKALLNILIVKKQKQRKKVSFDLTHFAEFLKAAIKQDQQDLRRLRIMSYENKKKISAVQKRLKSRDAIRKVDLELYEIKSKQLSTKLHEQTEEFLQLKKIFDSYQKRLNKFQKRLEINKTLVSQNQKTFAKKLRDLEVQQKLFRMALESLIELINVVSQLPAMKSLHQT